MPNSIRIGLLASVALLVLAVVLFLWHPVWLFYWQELRISNQIISKVESFRTSHGRLPETLNEVGMGGPDSRVYYDKLSEDEYRVWFGISSVGESETYNSGTKKWD